MKQAKKQKKSSVEEIIMRGWAVDEYSIFSVIEDLNSEDFEAVEKALEEFECLEWSDDLEPKIRKILLEELCFSEEEIAEIEIKDEFEKTQWNINKWWSCEARADLLKKLYR